MNIKNFYFKKLKKKPKAHASNAHVRFLIVNLILSTIEACILFEEAKKVLSL